MSATQPEDLDALTLAWRAVVFVDVVESVRLIQANEVDVIRRWRNFVYDVRDHVLPSRGGRLVRSLGDAMLLEFDAAPNALEAAFAIQSRIAHYNVGHGRDDVLSLRVGAHVAEIVIDDLDIFGKGVNLAARLATLAEPGEIVVSADFAERVIAGVDAEFEDLGDCFLKNLEAPVHAYRLTNLPGGEPVGVSVAAAESVRPIARDVDGQGPRIAVLRFDMGPGADLSAVVGDLIADAISTRLSAATAVRVISRLSCQVLGGRAISVENVGQMLGTQYVVSGRCSGSLDRLLVRIELAQSDGAHVIWTGRLNTSVADLLNADDDFSAEVAADVMRVVTEAELRRAITRPLPQLQGYSLQQAATQLMHRSSIREFEHSRVMLDHLVERYPRAASPHAWMADWYVLSVTKGVAKPSHELAVRALEHTRRALAADPECALALAVQGFVHCHVEGDLERAERRLGEALQANPNEPLAWLFTSVVHGFRGDGEQAWVAAQRALSLSPLDPQKHYFQSLAASAALAAKRHQDTILLAQDSLRINRSHLPTLRTLAIAQAESGDLEAARRSAERILEVSPSFTVADYVTGAPKGAEHGRARYAQALRAAGLPNH